jgi:hypothetical protein
MREVACASEKHRNTRSVCCRDYLFVTNAAARLNNRSNTSIDQNL